VRLALLSDIHGNLTALDAVVADVEHQSPDQVVCGGDLVLMGAQGAEVVDRLRELGWPSVVGNTDELLWRPDERRRQEEVAPKLRPWLRLLFEAYAPATRRLLGEERLGWLQQLPRELQIDDVLLMHAAPDDLWRAPMPNADDQELVETYGDRQARVVVYGHIHRPYVRSLGRLTVANSGSIGLPWDGDPRASYLLVEDGKARVIRVEYDVERAASELLRSGYPDAARLAEIRRRGRFLAPCERDDDRPERAG
jgi:putative phosphoesterase